MKIDVFTLFPRWFDWFNEQRHVRNALELGHQLDLVDMRATTPIANNRVDDTPYGGGAGMVIRVDVVEQALEARYGVDAAEAPEERRVIALAAGGRQFDDALASELAAEPEIALLCGRYEGFDERVHEHLASDVVSIGPYVLAGRRARRDGRLRRGDPEAARCARPRGERGRGVVRRRRSRARPEYPHYTRPPSGAAMRCRRCCSPATTGGSASGGSSAAASGRAATAARLTRPAGSRRADPSLPLPSARWAVPGPRALLLR